MGICSAGKTVRQVETKKERKGGIHKQLDTCGKIYQGQATRRKWNPRTASSGLPEAWDNSLKQAWSSNRQHCDPSNPTQQDKCPQLQHPFLMLRSVLFCRNFPLCPCEHYGEVLRTSHFGINNASVRMVITLPSPKMRSQGHSQAHSQLKPPATVIKGRMCTN